MWGSGGNFRFCPRDLKFYMGSYIWYWNGKTLRPIFIYEKVVFWDTLLCRGVDVICDILPTDNIEGNERGGGNAICGPY